MGTKPEAFTEQLVESLVIVLLLRDLGKQLQAPPDQVLPDHTKDLVLLQGLATTVQRQVLGVYDPPYHAEPLRHQIIAVVREKDAAYVPLDVVPLLFRLGPVIGRTARHKEQGAQLVLPLDTEVLYGEVVLTVVGKRLVEGGVLLIGDILALARPQGLVLVPLLPLLKRHTLS